MAPCNSNGKSCHQNSKDGVCSGTSFPLQQDDEGDVGQWKPAEERVDSPVSPHVGSGTIGACTSSNGFPLQQDDEGDVGQWKPIDERVASSVSPHGGRIGACTYSNGFPLQQDDEGDVGQWEPVEERVASPASPHVGSGTIGACTSSNGFPLQQDGNTLHEGDIGQWKPVEERVASPVSQHVGSGTIGACTSSNGFPLQQDGNTLHEGDVGQWKPVERVAIPVSQHVWPTRDGLRVKFRGHKFTIPSNSLQLVEDIDTSHGDLLEFHITAAKNSVNLSAVLSTLRSRYSDPTSSLFNPNLQFDVADNRLYVTMPSGMGSDLIAQLVIPQLTDYQSRVKHRFPERSPLILSGSSGLIQFDNVSRRLCGDGSIVNEKKLLQKTLEAHHSNRSVPKNLKAKVNFEALSFFDNKDALIQKCTHQVETEQAKVSVALCDREGDGEVLVFRKSGTQVVCQRCVNPRFIDLGMIIPSFRVYLSYGASIYFTAHHQYKMKELTQPDRLHLLCDSILQGDLEMAKEVINGLASIDCVDDNGRLPMVCAVERGDTEMIGYMLDNGAKVERIDARGVSPLLAARAEGHNSVAVFIQSRGAVIALNLHALVDAIYNSQSKRLEFLLKAGVDVDERDEVGRTALMHACSMVLKEDIGAAIKQLLRAGATKSLSDNRGRTARDIADYVGNPVALDILDDWEPTL